MGGEEGIAFSENRLNRFRESDILRHIFERVVFAAMEMGLVKGEGFAVDASVMEANASRYHGKAPDELDWTEKQQRKRAVAEYLAHSKPKRRLMAMPRMTTRVVDPRANDSAVMSASRPR